MDLDPYELLRKIQILVDVEGFSDVLKVELSWPAHGVVDRELTAADHAEAARLAEEEWGIVVSHRD